MDPEYFLWYENNYKALIEKYDELHIDNSEPLENYRIWEKFIHAEYLNYKEKENETIGV